MRRPFRQALAWLAALAVGAIFIRFGYAEQQRIGEGLLSTGVMVVGAMLAPIAFVFAIWALVLSIGRLRLIAGHNVMARWHVSASAWQRFCDLEPERNATLGLYNDYNAAKQSDHRGVDVIVGTKSALVGDSYHVLRPGGNPALHGIRLIEGSDPHCLEYAVSYYRKNGPAVRMALRIPFPPEARADASRVFDHFAPLLVPRISIALRRPRRTIAISLTVAAFGAAAAAGGLSEAMAGRQHGEIALIAAIVGAIVVPAAQILALATFLLARRNRAILEIGIPPQSDAAWPAG